MPLPSYNVIEPTETFDPYDGLTEAQHEQLRSYEQLLRRYNKTLNLISPDTIDAITERHILHTLALRVRDFPTGARIVDWGSGGGLPAIPLAIAYPEVEVIAVDSVGKKMQAVRSMARRLGLKNLFAWAGRAENWPDTAHYSVSRATAPLADLWQWHTRAVSELPSEPEDSEWAPGLITLKGGDLSDEIAALQRHDSHVRIQQTSLHTLLHDAAARPSYFAEKCLLAVQHADADSAGT
ncbi:MAG: 16S rRNA (guanine(527)-N(7))-methyltransferase RsmG [Longimonas sp.]|uniref:16S rRNA (guanine(527)-N(7))-methyltransferase RsmG n=1 Tax=Longimonas sp. TaxID=2039626 RepID=UPI003358EA51